MTYYPGQSSSVFRVLSLYVPNTTPLSRIVQMRFTIVPKWIFKTIISFFAFLWPTWHWTFYNWTHIGLYKPTLMQVGNKTDDSYQMVTRKNLILFINFKCTFGALFKCQKILLFNYSFFVAIFTSWSLFSTVHCCLNKKNKQQQTVKGECDVKLVNDCMLGAWDADRGVSYVSF